MASTRPNPASPSDEKPDIPLGVRVQRQGATGPAGQPGTVRLVALKGDELHELEGTAAMEKLPELVADARLRGLGRSRRPDGKPGRPGRRGPWAPSPDHRGRARGESAGQDRDDQRDRPHRPVPPELRRDGHRIGARHRPRTRLSPDRPQHGLGPARGAPPGGGPQAGPRARAGPPAVGDRGRPDRRLFPLRRSDRRRHRRRPGPGRPEGDPGHGRGAVQAQARADPGPPRDQPGARGVQPADQPRRDS